MASGRAGRPPNLRLTSVARLLARPEAADRAVRWALVGKLGHIRRRRLRSGKQGFLLDFRPYGRVWSNRGIPITDEEHARRLLEQIRGKVAEGRDLESVLAEYAPIQSKANLVQTRLAKWLEVRRRECAAGSLSPAYLKQLEQLANPGGYFSFFDGKSIFEVTYGVLEDFSLWLADRGLTPKSRRNYLAAFRSFLVPEVPRLPLPKADEHEPRLLAIRDQDRVIAAISDEERGIFLALARLGLRPGEARAAEVADYHDGWLTIDKAMKGKSVSAEIRGTKSGKPKRLPVDADLASWVERHVHRAGRLRAAPPTGRFRPRSPGDWS